MCIRDRTGTLPERPGKEEVRDMMLRHARLQLKYKGEFIGIREMRKHVAWYTKEMCIRDSLHSCRIPGSFFQKRGHRKCFPGASHLILSEGNRSAS